VEPIRIAITGFGAFGAASAHPVDDNPSRAIAFALEREPPAGVVVAARELSVTFRRAPEELERWLDSLALAPHALLGLGVQSKGGVFRLERRARGRLEDPRTDNDGITASDATRELSGELETDLDLAALERALRSGGAHDVLRSESAGGFVCERLYHALLEQGARRRVPALFLHLPKLEQAALDVQTRVVAALVGELARQVRERGAR
jgi:pyrrolidone-carboxylate peptidase